MIVEDWPRKIAWRRFTQASRNRGRIVFDRARDLFIIYADRKLLTPATFARIETRFHLPAECTEIQCAEPGEARIGFAMTQAARPHELLSCGRRFPNRRGRVFLPAASNLFPCSGGIADAE